MSDTSIRPTTETSFQTASLFCIQDKKSSKLIFGMSKLRINKGLNLTNAV